MKIAAPYFLPFLLLLGAAQATQPLPRAQVESLVQPLIDGEYVQGMVVGIVDSDGPRVYGFGKRSDRDARAPDGDTLFEIGSITKVFTSLLLSEMSQRQVVQLNDPVQKFLPDSVRLNPKAEKAITLLDLSTHQSGLPRMPGNLNASNLVDPFAAYTPELLYQFLNGWKPVDAPGERVEYSNLGVGLLGHALAWQAGLSYEELLNQRITGPLKMSSTSIRSSESQQARLAQPHDADGNPVQNWTFTDATAGAGAIRSTANDMLRFIQAQIQPPQDTLGEAIVQTHQVRNRFDPNNEIGLGWIISKRGFIWHNGATGGYHSFAAFSPERKVGIVVLANGASAWPEITAVQIVSKMMGVDPGPLPKVRSPIKLDPAKLDRFTGSYFLGSIITIRRDGDRLFALMMGQPEFRIYPESETSCFWKAVNAQIEFTFGPEPDAKAIRVTIHQNGRNIPAIRVPDPPTTQAGARP